MSAPATPEAHPVASRRKARGWSQDQLAAASGIPRSSVSAIEAGRLTPSVAAALALAAALEGTVEELFGKGSPPRASEPAWAWQPRFETLRYWEAEVAGRRLLFPAEARMASAGPHDGVCRGGVLHDHSQWQAAQTLVLAGCDPASGLLASEYTSASGFRMISFTRGGAAALEMLRQGVVHIAALHRSTKEQPGRNAETARSVLGGGCRLLRGAEWQEGIALAADHAARSVTACVKNTRRWAMREKGSAARECLDELLGAPRGSRHTLTSHAAVAEAVSGGWAEAGVCVQLSAEEAGLRFLPVRTEALDFCFPAALENDPRLQAFVRLVRSRTHRRLVDELPGYDARHAGEMSSI